ncbi:hypothetical protein V8G54_004375 [Vigna mungo]|uniref:MULE transposase domain-containing protein n=1 Tax=Vigna mungo TaxID=3915 RepID=A0AAQ3SF45_VIGMU
MANSDVEVVFHHVGKFQNNGTFSYHYGQTITLNIDPDQWSYFEILSILKEMGYRNVKELWYSLGRGLVSEDCLELLSDDKGGCHLVNIAMLNGQAHVYVYLLELEYSSQPKIERPGGETEVEKESAGKQVEIKVGEAEVKVVGDTEVQAISEVEVQTVGHVEPDVEAKVEVEAEVQVEVEAVTDLDVVVEAVADVQPQVYGVAEVEGNGVEGQGQADVQADEYDVRSWNGSEEDVLTDDGDEVECNIFEATNQVEIGGPRGLSESDRESEGLNNVVESDNTDNDKDGYGDFGIFSLPKRKCPWYAYYAYKAAENTWQLRKIIDKHTCSREFNIRLMTSKWLSGRLEKTIKENPNVNLYNLQNKVCKKWIIGVYRSTTCRAKVMAFKQIEANAVVEVENKESWTWFLELLIEDLGGKDVCVGITFISDQQKGLLAVFQDLLPGVEQRFCVRHLYSNFRKSFPGKNLKRLMWRAAIATHPQQWEAEMRNIKAINVEAFKYLLSIPPRFIPRSQCDTLVNNMSEAFNSVLVDNRSKPIISMLEDIRVYIMKRWAANKTKMTQYHASICPKVWNRFQKESSLGRYWLPKWSREKLFEVMHISEFGHQFVVNKMGNYWHSLYTCHNINAGDYITHWFRKSTYEETYNNIIYPINGQHIWEVTPYSDILPPKKKTMPGRPKKKQRLEEWELKKNDSELRKGGQRKKCGICHELGHNKKGCPQRPTAQSASEQTQGTQGPPTDVPLT